MEYEMASRQSISLEYLHFPFRFYPDLQVRNKRKTRLSIIISSWTFTLNTAHSHHHHHRWDGIAIEWVTQNVFKKTSFWSLKIDPCRGEYLYTVTNDDFVVLYCSLYNIKREVIWDTKSWMTLRVSRS